MLIHQKTNISLHRSSEHTASQTSSFSWPHPWLAGTTFLLLFKDAPTILSLSPSLHSGLPILRLYTLKRASWSLWSYIIGTDLHCTFIEIIINELLPVFNLQQLIVLIVKILCQLWAFLYFLSIGSFYTSSRLESPQLPNFTLMQLCLINSTWYFFLMRLQVILTRAIFHKFMLIGINYIAFF